MSLTHKSIRRKLVVDATDQENMLFTGLVDDIAEGGIFVATHVPPPIGDVVDVELRFAEGGERLLGVVRWVRSFELASDGCPPGCGVEWLEMSDEAMARIRSFAAESDTLFAFDAAA